MKITLRPVSPAEARLLWRWANDPATRRWSYTRGRISWKSHREWLERKLAAPEKARLYIGRDARGRPAGQVRFEMKRAGTAMVSISVDSRFRGQGMGTVLLRAGCLRAAKDLGVRRIVAHVMRANLASRKAFLKAGFRRIRSFTARGIPSQALEFRYPGQG